ncbi:hypothetical protein GCM10009608_52410 [Pseudonocardia alaniniphila]
MDHPTGVTVAADAPGNPLPRLSGVRNHASSPGLHTIRKPVSVAPSLTRPQHSPNGRHRVDVVFARAVTTLVPPFPVTGSPAGRGWSAGWTAGVRALKVTPPIASRSPTRRQGFPPPRVMAETLRIRAPPPITGGRGV